MDAARGVLDSAFEAAGGHGRIEPADPTEALAIAAKGLGTRLHPVITASATAVVALLAWQRQSLTPLALLSLAGLAVAQTTHGWPAFFGLFLALFLVTSLVAPTNRTNAGFVVSSTLVATVLHNLWTYFLPERMSTIALYLLNSSPPICLPRPSQTLQFAERYTYPVAFFGQLPFGAVVSFASAAAMTVSSRLVRSDGITPQGLLAGLLGALPIAAVAAVTLPFCTEDMTNSHLVLNHIDGRSLAWSDRVPFDWTDTERYGVFVGLVALAGAAAVVVDSLLANRVPDRESQEGGYRRYARQLLANLLVSATVILGLAIWSQMGNVEEEDDD